MMSDLIHWAALVGGCCLAMALMVGLVKDGIEFARGYESVSIGRIIAKAIALITGIGITMFFTTINIKEPTILDNSIQLSDSEVETETVVDELSTEQAADVVVEEPEPIVEEVAKEPEPIIDENSQLVTEIVQAEPVVSTPDPNWMPKDTLEESWNYAVEHKWTIMYKGKEMDPKYISYKYYNISFDKDRYIVTLTDK